jgi:hypothetical protein
VILATQKINLATAYVKVAISALYEGWHPGIHLVPEANKITPGNLRHQEVSACKL